MAERQTKGGGKLNRTQTVTLRLDPKLRYLTELASRSQRRTTSSFIEWAIEESLKHVYLERTSEFDRSLAEDALTLWDVDEPDRFIKLATSHPALLTHDEQIIWKLINERNTFWACPDHTYENLNKSHIRTYWELIQKVANGEETVEKFDLLIGENVPF